MTIVAFPEPGDGGARHPRRPGRERGEPGLRRAGQTPHRNHPDFAVRWPSIDENQPMIAVAGEIFSNVVELFRVVVKIFRVGWEIFSVGRK